MPAPRSALAVAVAIAITATATPAEQASADVLRHEATGFAVSAPPDFKASFHRPSTSYVISSRRRHAAIRYQRLQTSYSPRVVGRLLAVASTATNTVVKVRRAGPRALTVTRFDRRSWSDKRRLLTRIGRSIRGGRAVLLGGKRKRSPERKAPTRRPRPAPAEPQPETPAPTPSTPGQVLFRGDFESGTFEDWYVQSLSSRVGITSQGAFGSGHAARFEVRDGDVEPDTGSERSEVSGPDIDEGQDVYFRDTFRIPSGSSIGTSWQIINQLHEHDWDGSPGVAVFLDSGPSLRIGAGDGSPTFVEDIQIQYDRWHDLVYRANLSRDPKVGFVEAWLDGTPLELDNGQTRIYGQTLQTDSAYLKAGIYRGRASTGTSIVEHDNLTIATSLEAATRTP